MKPLSILVVDDDPLAVRLYRTTLERHRGHQIHIVGKVEEILGMIRSRMVDLVILDVSSSNLLHQGVSISGYDVATLLRDSSVPYVPVLVVTAHTVKGDGDTLLATTQSDDYLEKPIDDPEKLMEKIRTLIAKNDSLAETDDYT